MVKKAKKIKKQLTICPNDSSRVDWASSHHLCVQDRGPLKEQNLCCEGHCSAWHVRVPQVRLGLGR